ncbi:methyltransferase [Mesorhizobium sp.]|uniref:methyltransferase n=1 Tax=Mesorhizobium sp. TaxID=1871066 RepID=UPI0025D13C57|nr:methyltransferase [Mesorhizobium sp.]
MNDEKDNPGVAVFPPLLFLVALILMLALRYVFPLAIGGRPLTMVLGIVLAALAIAIIAWGRMTMQRAGTNIEPTKPTLAIVTGGPFRFARNPLYVGLMGLLPGTGSSSTPGGACSLSSRSSSSCISASCCARRPIWSASSASPTAPTRPECAAICEAMRLKTKQRPNSSTSASVGAFANRLGPDHRRQDPNSLAAPSHAASRAIKCAI